MIEKEMNIIQAVNHLTWRLGQQKMIPNQKDKEAFNLILTTLNQNYELSIEDDRLFSKLLIEKLMFLTMSGERTMKDAIRIIKEILSTPIHQHSETFKKMVPRIRLIRAFENCFINVKNSESEIKNSVKVSEAKNILMAENKKHLSEEFTKEYNDEEFKAFIQKLVFDLKTEFQNNP